MSNEAEQRALLQWMYDDYVAFCNKKGTKPMTYLEFIEAEIRASEQPAVGPPS